MRAGAGAGARGKVTGEVERRPGGQLNVTCEDGLPTGTGPRGLVHTHTRTRTRTLSVAQVQAAGWKEDFSADYMSLFPSALSTQASGSRSGGAGTGHSWNARPGFSGSNLPPAVSGRGGAPGVTSIGPVPTALAPPHSESLRLRPWSPGQLMWQPGWGPGQGRPWKPAEQTRTASPASGPHGQYWEALGCRQRGRGL